LITSCEREAAIASVDGAVQRLSVERHHRGVSVSVDVDPQ